MSGTKKPKSGRRASARRAPGQPRRQRNSPPSLEPGSSIDPAALIAGIPDTLREELLKHFTELSRNYRQSHWEAATLNAGKFVEVVYSILRGRADGSYPDRAQKPRDMVQACRALESEDEARMGGRGLRILVPRAIPPVYEMRNNRGVGHAGAEVDPSHMDAEYAFRACQWMLAELVRVFHALDTQTARAVTELLIERTTPLVWEIGGVKRVLDPGMRAQDRVLLLLYATPGAVDQDELLRWSEYKNAHRFQEDILRGLHDLALIHHDQSARTVALSPLGRREVEARLLVSRALTG